MSVSRYMLVNFLNCKDKEKFSMLPDKETKHQIGIRLLLNRNNGCQKTVE